jgi:hypothetical protein
MPFGFPPELAFSFAGIPTRFAELTGVRSMIETYPLEKSGRGLRADAERESGVPGRVDDVNWPARSCAALAIAIVARSSTRTAPPSFMITSRLAQSARRRKCNSSKTRGRAERAPLNCAAECEGRSPR